MLKEFPCFFLHCACERLVYWRGSHVELVWRSKAQALPLRLIFPRTLTLQDGCDRHVAGYKDYQAAGRILHNELNGGGECSQTFLFKARNSSVSW